jgi:hypothetical protein
MEDEAAEHQSHAVWSEYLVTWARDVFENLQSEFIQLLFQSFLLAGACEFLKIKAYEEDQEELKQQLARIETPLAERRGDSRPPETDKAAASIRRGRGEAEQVVVLVNSSAPSIG